MDYYYRFRHDTEEIVEILTIFYGSFQMFTVSAIYFSV